MEKLYSWLILRSIKGLGERSIKKLWERFGSAEKILNANAEELESLLGRGKAWAVLERRGIEEKKIERILRVVVNNNINCELTSINANITIKNANSDCNPIAGLFGTIWNLRGYHE